MSTKYNTSNEEFLGPDMGKWWDVIAGIGVCHHTIRWHDGVFSSSVLGIMLLMTELHSVSLNIIYKDSSV